MNIRPVDRLVVALAQLNPLMGDIAGNLRKARTARAEAAAAGADLISLFSELFITGYPPEDLVLKPALQNDAREAIDKFALDTADGGPAVLIGTPWVEEGKLYNASVSCSMVARSLARRSKSICRITACSTRSVCSRRGRCRDRSTSAGCASACRCARTSGRRKWSNA